MLHKTGSRAVEDEGLTTQQWAVLGALSQPWAESGISMGNLASYLMVSRQSISELIHRMERNGHLRSVADPRDRRARLIMMTDSGREVWITTAMPKINHFYDQALMDFSINDTAHFLHYLLKLLDNFKLLDADRVVE
jgi:DNA-binding MarR family transcriptional regulator